MYQYAYTYTNMGRVVDKSATTIAARHTRFGDRGLGLGMMNVQGGTYPINKYTNSNT